MNPDSQDLESGLDIFSTFSDLNDPPSQTELEGTSELTTEALDSLQTTSVQSQGLIDEVLQEDLIVPRKTDHNIDTSYNNYNKADLHEAVKDRDLSTVKSLITQGADIHTQSVFGATALHAAVEGGNEAMIHLLIEKGVALNATDQFGITALHEAARLGYKAIVQLLLERGADIKNVWQSSELSELVKEPILRLLLEKRPKAIPKEYLDIALHSAVARGDEAVVQLLIDAGANINMRNAIGETALHSAVKRGDVDMVRICVNKRVDEAFSTALQLAVSERYSNLKIAQLLLANGADIKEIRTQPQNKDIAQLLQNYGAVWDDSSSEKGAEEEEAREVVGYE